MSTLGQFLAYNLLPALGVGIVVWAVVVAGVTLLGVRHGKLRLCLLSAPLIKSTLLLLGIGLAFPWPRELAEGWHARAIEPARVLPVLLIFTGVAVIGSQIAAARARRRALAGAQPADHSAHRLKVALDDVMARFGRSGPTLVKRCGCEPRLRRPHLMVASGSLRTPLIATDEPPAIVFPAALVERLNDAELRGALAHEVAHLEMRSHLSCSLPAALRWLLMVNPLGRMMAAHLLAEEEKACDDVAVAVTGDAESYAGMLLAAHRFSRPPRAGFTRALGALPSLLGARPMIAQRIERLVGDRPAGSTMGVQYAGFAVLWVVLATLFFST